MILVTGPQAAGKSTVSRLLAARFQRGVHLEADVFRRFIITGREEMAPNPSDEARRQLQLRHRMAASVARAYADAGFSVVLEDVVAGPMLAEVVKLLRMEPSRVVVLMPSRDVIAARESGREEKAYGRWSVDQLYEVFETDTPRIGHWLDSSRMSPDQTVDAILARIGE